MNFVAEIRHLYRRYRCAGVTGALLLSMLAACSGSTGSAGPAGPAGATGPAGPPGPTGPVTALNVSTATQMTATITSVTIPASPAAAKAVVKFTLVNQLGQPLSGLTAGNLGFVIAKLVLPETQLLAVPPQPQTFKPTPQISSQWQSYIYHTAKPADASAGTPSDPVVGKTDQPQATVESGTSGTFVDNGDGTYQYTFAKDISTDHAVTYDATLTHRVGFEIRGTTAPANSPVYTFQPSTGATTGITAREIVDDQTCKNCHMQLAFHGGARTEVQYCVMCHNPSSIDPSSGNSLDFKVMFHKIHMGANLPSVQGAAITLSANPGTGSNTGAISVGSPANGPYNAVFNDGEIRGATVSGATLSWAPALTANQTAATVNLTSNYYIFGFRYSISDYSSIAFPTGDLRTCYTCHNEKDTKTPQTVNWKNVPNSEACGSCHDNVNFQTGANHSAANLGGLTDGDCATCHGQTTYLHSTSIYYKPPATSGTLKVDDVHVIPERDYQKKIQYQILSVKNTAPGLFPVINFKVVDPTNNNAPWNVLQNGGDEPFTHCNPMTDVSLSNINAVIAWSTTDYTNVGSGNTSEAAEPITIPVTCTATAGATAPVRLGDGSFTVTSLTKVPVGTVGSAGVMLQGHPAHEFGTGNTAWFPDGAGTNREIPIPNQNALFFAPITDTTVTDRRDVVDVQKCDVCHDQLNAHGNNRVDSVQMCATCHNPNATDVLARVGSTPSITPANPDPTDKLAEQTIDLKVMIHAIHAAPDLASFAPTATPYVVYHNIGAPTNAHNWINSTPFPGSINNCLGCHLADTYYPPDPTSAPTLATTTSTYVTKGVPNGGPAGQVAMTPATAACSACHVTVTAKNHMTLNGGSFSAMKDASSQVTNGETCIVCHGSGATADVAVVHKLSSFQ